VLLAAAYGTAHRGWAIPNTLDTRCGIASGTKGPTALTVMSLVEEGRLGLDTTARSVLGADLPLVDDRVTVEHLLAHRSGSGDHLDEEAGWDVTGYVVPVPVHRLDTTEDYLAEDYLAALGGGPTSRPGASRSADVLGG
jgi:CubicO group peptidase (beta-lactamase class C family)